MKKEKLLRFLAPPGSGDPTDGRRAGEEKNKKKGEKKMLSAILGAIGAAIGVGFGVYVLDNYT